MKPTTARRKPFNQRQYDHDYQLKRRRKLQSFFRGMPPIWKAVLMNHTNVYLKARRTE